ncbi:MAG TPA: exodeoxyribonuclease VII large subunit [Miltoncostaeaceae bacterium]|nr:exodeoxyribonuclease VII large subunit [Miltoncostaeaceae bacterium]
MTEVTGALARRLEGIPQLWIEAEIHSIGRRGGHVYFTLVDDHQISGTMRAVVWDRLPLPPRDGDLVHVRGDLEFWAARTSIRLRAERIEHAGLGLLLAEVAALRARLEAEGLFAPARKRPLPMLPRRIGLVTSARGAARDDFLRCAWARFPADVLLHDVPVQGPASPDAVARAIAALDAHPQVDVIVVTRGGGPLEDLMGFNSEVVCRAIAAATTPIVSAVGHERDTTLCDLAADLRVSTPTAAAEAVVPDHTALSQRLDGLESTLGRDLGRVRARAEERCGARAAALAAGLRAVHRRSEARLTGTSARLAPALSRLPASRARLVDATADRLGRAGPARVAEAGARLERAAAVLEVLSPRRTLRRGYAILRDDDGRPVTTTAAARAGQELTAELDDGRVRATVTGVER